MSSALRPGRFDSIVIAVSLLGFLQFTAAGLAVIFGFDAAERPVLFGLSVARIVLAIGAFAIAGVLLAGCLLLRRRLSIIRRLVYPIPARTQAWLAVLGALAAAILWISIFSPADVFAGWSDYFSRLRPLLTASSLLGCEVWIAVGLSRRTGSLWDRIRALHGADPRSFWVILVSLVSVWLVMLVTRFGIAKIGPFWNPPGVPLTGLQGIGVVLLICLGVSISTVAALGAGGRGRRLLRWLVPLFLYLGALLIWGLTPMERHYFSLRPGPPSFQPFPFSDARFLDLGGLSVASGQGIFFHGFTDKPLYMVFLGLLHLLAGDNYVMLTWLQLGLLAAIPVVLYMLGKQFDGEVLGMAVALMTILQQRNSILESRAIDSVNPRLLMTEVPTLLAMTIIALLLFKWCRTRRRGYALASGAAIAAASLVRANPIFLLPPAALLAVVALWTSWRTIFRHLLIFAAGFCIVFAPWLVTGVNEDGVPWFWVKFQYVVSQRYQSSTPRAPFAEAAAYRIHSTPRIAPSTSLRNVAYDAGGGAAPSTRPMERSSLEEALLRPSDEGLALAVPSVVQLALSHSLHNGAAALLSLPDLVSINTIDELAQNPPWRESGDLSLPQHLGVALNLILLAVGMAWCWHRFSWAGAVPAVLFLGYDLGLAAATTSGGRYIVPVNWVAHFYLAAGWVAVAKALIRPGGTRAPRARTSGDAKQSPTTRLTPWIVGTLCVALVVPFANAVMPAFTQTHIEEKARANLAPPNNSAALNVQLAYGKVLYPEYQRRNGTIDFFLLTDHGYRPDLTVPRKAVFPYAALDSGSLGVAGFSQGAGSHRAEFLYVTKAR